jgi:hypothetical protein
MSAGMSAGMSSGMSAGMSSGMSSGMSAGMTCYNSAVHIHSCSLVTSLPRLLSFAASPVNSDGWRPRVFIALVMCDLLSCGCRVVGRSP